MQYDPQGPFKIFISYSHDSDEHKANVAALVADLKARGFLPVVDWEHRPDVTWAAWMEKQILAADVILSVCTETYKRRIEPGLDGTGDGGGGAVWEGNLIRNILYSNNGRLGKVVPVVMRARDIEQILTALQGFDYFDVSLAARRQALIEMLARRAAARAATSRRVLTINESAGFLTRPEGRQVPFLVPQIAVKTLIGRGDLMDDLKQRLRDGGRYTLHGPAGVGKTSVAVALARDPDLLQHFHDGVLWASLGPTQQADARLATWSTALGVDPGAEQRVDLHALKAAVAPRHMLLVVDDAWSEESLAPFLEVWKASRNSSLLVTTRRDTESNATSDAKRVAALLPGERLKLLSQPQVCPACERGADDAVQDLLSLSAGLPLALLLVGRFLTMELFKSAAEPQDGRRMTACAQDAAAELRRLIIEVKVESGATDVTGEARPRQVPPPPELLAAIRLCDAAVGKVADRARRALRTLSIFPPKPNSFSDTAARRVAAEPQEALAPPEVLELLLAYGLIERSTPDAHPGASAPRYSLHQTIQEYAERQRQDDSAYDRMVEFYIDFGMLHAREYAALRTEQRNILAAIGEAARRNRADVLVRAMNAFYDFFLAHGLYMLPEVRNIPRQVQELAAGLGERAHIDALINSAVTDEKLGRYAEAQASLAEGLRAACDPAQRCELQYWEGVVAFNRGRYDDAEKKLREALKLAGQSMRRETVCRIFERLCLISFYRGDHVQAESHAQTAVTFAADLPDSKRVKAFVLRDLGRIALVGERYDDAAARAREGLELAKNLGLGPSIQAGLLQIRARVALEQGRAGDAGEDMHNAFSMVEQIGHRWYMSFLEYERGKVHLRRSDLDSAHQYFQHAEEIAKTLESPDLQAFSGYGLARVARQRQLDGVARHKARKSLDTLERIGHFKKDDVRRFLDELPPGRAGATS